MTTDKEAQDAPELELEVEAKPLKKGAKKPLLPDPDDQEEEEEGEIGIKKKAKKPPKSLKILPAHLKSGRTPGDKVTKHVPYIGGSRRFGAYTRPIDTDLTEGMLPPITRKKIATYEVLAFAKKDPLIKEGGAEIAPMPVILPGRYAIEDKFEKNLTKVMKVIQNVVGKERKDVINPLTGQTDSHMVDLVQDVIMDNGYATVNMETEYAKYIFMELHPMNLTNKHRNAAKHAAVFRRSDFQMPTAVSRQFEMDLAMDAEQLVRKMDKDEVINLAAAFNIPTMGRRIDEMRYDLRLIARQDPKKLMFQRQDEFATVRINVKDAMDWGLIDYIPEKSEYYFAADMSNPFHKVLFGEDPQESLAEFCLSEEGAEAYQEIITLTGFWNVA